MPEAGDSGRARPSLRVSVVIPAFDEEAVIGRLIEEVAAAIRGWDAEILAVDDGSSDGTGAVLASCATVERRLRVLHHGSNLGKAAAIRTALAHATGDVVLVQDADLEYSPRDYAALLAPFADPGVEAVYGSRFLLRPWPSGMAVANWMANKLFVGLTNLLYGSALTDEGTGYKVFRRRAIEAAGIASSRFEFCPEITAKLLRRGARIVEVPVSYEARSREGGKKPGVRDGVAVLWALLRYRIGS